MSFIKYLWEGISTPFKDIKFLILLIAIMIGWLIWVATDIYWFMLLTPIIIFLVISYFDYKKKSKPKDI